MAEAKITRRVNAYDRCPTPEIGITKSFVYNRELVQEELKEYCGRVKVSGEGVKTLARNRKS